MEVYISESTPVLRIMTDISEIKNIGPEGDVAANESSPYGNYKDCKSTYNGQTNQISRRKPLNPLLGCNPYRARANHGGSFHPVYSNTQSNVSTFTKRVLSAKLLKFKQLQNQLFETQSQLNEVMNENKVLKTVHKRQDNALKKYEGGHEQLPQLIKSHNEEMRILSAKYKQLKSNYRDLENKLKQRDSDLFNLREQHKHLVKLSKDKHLGDREKLTKRLEELERLVKEQQNKIQVLNRKVILEGKNYRHQLTLEINKHKETQNQLNAALEAFENLKYSVEGKGRYVTFQKKFPQVGGYSVQQPMNLPGPSRVSIRQSTQGLEQSEATFMNGTETNSTVSSVAYSNQCRETSSDDTLNKDDMDHAVASVHPPSDNSEETWRVEKLSGFLRKEIRSNNISRYPLNCTEPIKLDKVKVKEKCYIRNKVLSTKLKNGKMSCKESNSESHDYSINDKAKIKSKERKTKEHVLYPLDSLYEKEDQEHCESQVGSSNEGVEFQSPSTASLSDTFINDTRNQFKEDEDWNLSHYESGNNDNVIEDIPGRRNSTEWFNIDMDNEFKEYLLNSNISLSKPNDKIESEDNIDFIEKKLLSLDVNKNRNLVEDCPKTLPEETCCDESDASNTEIASYEIKKNNKRLSKDLQSNTSESDNFVKLDDMKKADLLKALYEIDKDEKGEDFAEKAGIDAFAFSSVKGKEYFEEAVDIEKAKKKSNIMKELFG